MNILGKRGGIAAIETELKNLGSRRETLEGRKAKAAANLDAARSSRKAALSGDPEADLSKLTLSVQQAADELETIDSVLADIADQTADAEQRLADAKDTSIRTSVAKELSDYADRYDAAAADLDTALKAVAKAYAALAKAIPDTLAVVELDGRVTPTPRGYQSPDGLLGFEDYRQSALPNDLARVVLAEGLAKVCPTAFPYIGARPGWRVSLDRASRLEGQPTFRVDDIEAMAMSQTAKEAAASLVSGRLRKRAATIIAGEAKPDLGDQAPWKPAEAGPAPIPRVEVFAVENFGFRLEDRDLPTLCGKRWVHQLPEDAAVAAVQAGVALRTDNDEGAKAFEEEKARRRAGGSSCGSSFLRIDMCRDLGVIRPVEDAETAETVVSLPLHAA
jgi:hypothetical protein